MNARSRKPIFVLLALIVVGLVLYKASGFLHLHIFQRI